MMPITPQVESLIDRALAEDAAFNDITTDALIPTDLQAKAHITAKAAGILAGADVALAVFRRLDSTLEATALLTDGSRLYPGIEIARIQGSAAGILQAERTALNLLQRMCGVATETARYVEAVKGLNARIVDTRKTAPGLRELDKTLHGGIASS